MEKTDNNLYETLRKLEKILWKLLESNFKIKNDLNLNLLLTHCTGKKENGVIGFKHELKETFFHWIIASTNLWNEKKNAPSPVLTFALKVGSQLSEDENYFVRLKNKNVYGKLAEIAIENQEFDIYNNVGLITMLSSVLEYPSGVQWLLTKSYWNDIIDTALKGHTKYIKQKAYHFIIKLLETSILLEKDFCEQLVEVLVEPLIEAAVQSEFVNKSEEENENIYKSLKPNLDLVSEVTDTLLKNFNKNVLNIFLDIEIPGTIQTVLNFSKIQDFSFDLLKIRFVFLFYCLCGKLEGSRRTAHDADTLFDIGIMFDLIKAEIEKDHVRCVIKICYHAHLLYCNLDTHMPLCIRKGESIEFQNQMILVQLVPVMTLGQQFLGTHKSKQLSLNDDLRQNFYVKLAKISAIKTLEITVRWEQRLSTKSDLIEDVTLSLQYIIKSKKIMKKEQAAIIFQPLIYSLKDAVCHLEMYREINMPLREKSYFKILVDTIIDLVESFDLTWKDSIETISVLDLACEIVHYDYADFEVTAHFLKLLNVAISRCMAPNMVLLMVNTNDTIISQVGCLIYSKCHNRSSQVRNNALEVVRTLALNASAKFPEFTDVLFNAKLPLLVVNMALTDASYEVRGTAMKCLQALIMVEDIYEEYQSNDDFWDTILKILVYEPKGTVRKEAATILCDILKRCTFPDNVLPRVYDGMTHAGINDLHWEVKRTALYFWSLSIESHLQSQGMCDRMFPEYVFSKEKKKIIILTPTEVRKRVIQVLNQVSNIGAIYVLNTALQDEFDEEVSKYAKHIALKTVGLFTALKITPDDVGLEHAPYPADSGNQSNPVSPTSSDSQSSLKSDPLSPTSSDIQLCPQGHFDLELLQAQCPKSPSFSDLYYHSSNTVSPENKEELSPLSYTATSTPSSSYSNSSFPYGQSNTQVDSATITGGVENSNICDTSCQKDDILISACDIDLEVVLAENMENSIDANIAETGELFDELLHLDDTTRMEEMVDNSGYQVKTPTVIKTRQYLPPSEYVRSCLELAKAKENTSSQLVHDFDGLDTVLNKLLTEYDVDLST